MDQLRQSLLGVPIIEKGDYEYFVHFISDGVPMLEPGLLREVVIKIIHKANPGDADKIVTPAVTGIHILTAVSLMTNIPLVVIRKREYGLDGEMSLYQQTGYSEGDVFTNDIGEGGRVLIPDDALSVGGTVKAVLNVLGHIDADIVDTITIIKKAGPNELGDSDHHVKMLINVTIEDDGVVIVGEHGGD